MCFQYNFLALYHSILGAYAEWISSHSEVLSHVVPLLMQGITNSQLAQSATLALKDVVRENQQHLKPYVGTILSTGQQVLQSGELKVKFPSKHLEEFKMCLWLASTLYYPVVVLLMLMVRLLSTTENNGVIALTTEK